MTAHTKARVSNSPPTSTQKRKRKFSLIATSLGVPLALMTLWLKPSLWTQPPLSSVVATPASATITSLPAQQTGFRLVGTVSDLNGHTLPGMTLRIGNSSVQSDAKGAFVFTNAPLGDQTLTLTPPSGKGEYVINVRVERANPPVLLTLDTQKSTLGFLSLNSPVDEGELDIRWDGNEYLATIYGTYSGLPEMFKTPDIRILVKSDQDERFWLQHPGAVIDPTQRSWHATIKLGDERNRPRPGQQWTLLAVASDRSLGLHRVVNTPDINLLPPRISSNVALVTLQEARMR